MGIRQTLVKGEENLALEPIVDSTEALAGSLMRNTIGRTDVGERTRDGVLQCGRTWIWSPIDLTL